MDLVENMYQMAAHILKGADVHLMHQVALEKAQLSGERSKASNHSLLSARSRHSQEFISEVRAGELLDVWKRAIVLAEQERDEEREPSDGSP